MGEQEKLKMICSECGQCPVDAGGDVAVYTDRVRRRVFLVWVGLVFLLGVLGLPWVQMAIGHWGFRHKLFNVGNINAVMDDRGDFEPGDMVYQVLAQPPIRWRDLELVARGDVDAAEYFRQAVERTVEYPSNFSMEYSEYEFAVGTPKYYFNSDSVPSRSEDGEYQFTLLNKEYASVGWPDPWVGTLTTHWYRPDPERFAHEGLRSVEDDLIHVATADRKVRWRSVLFVVGLVVSIGYLAGRVCVWKRVGRRRSVRIGFIAMGVLAAGVLVAGMSRRNVPGLGITGYVNPVVQGVERSWDIEELEAVLASDERVRVLGQTLLEDFGEMTEPDELVALGIGSSVGSGMYFLDFGYGPFGQFRLMSFLVGETARLEDDGSYTVLPVPEEVRGWNFHIGNRGIMLSWSPGKSAKTMYGVRIDYRNLFFMAVGVYVLLRALRVVGFWWARRVQRRRLGRRVCVWCGYPCGE
jgi:hypothetical protein